MTPVAWALLAFVLLAALGALLARAGRSPSGPGAATAPQEAGPPAVVPPPADAGKRAPPRGLLRAAPGLRRVRRVAGRVVSGA